jgi:hypothetical protein
MKFIELTYSDDTKTTINFEHVVCFEASTKYKGLTTVIIVGLVQEILVKETVQQINTILTNPYHRL